MKKINKWFLAAGVFVILAGLLFCIPKERDTAVFENEAAETVPVPASLTEPEATAAAPQKEQPDEDKRVVVYVCGAVKNPGVYELIQGARAGEAIAMAEGFTKGAAEFYVNQAQELSDGERLYIPLKKELGGWKGIDGSPPESKEEESGKININTAGAKELQTIPGIGQAKAEAILKYREQNGEFKSTEDIMKIDGIKEGSYHKMKDYITISATE